MGGGHKDGLGADAVHVDADAGLEVVQVDVPVLGDQVDHPVLRTDLGDHGRQSYVRQRREACLKWSGKASSRQRFLLTCIATGKSVWASGGKKTSTAFLANGWLPVAG